MPEIDWDELTQAALGIMPKAYAHIRNSKWGWRALWMTGGSWWAAMSKMPRMVLAFAPSAEWSPACTHQVAVNCLRCPVLINMGRHLCHVAAVGN